MFKYWAIKKYGKQLLPLLQKRYGKQKSYTPHQIRATVYQCGFNPLFLPLGYILFLDATLLDKIMRAEFPNLCVFSYKQEISDFLNRRRYQGFLEILAL